MAETYRERIQQLMNDDFASDEDRARAVREVIVTCSAAAAAVTVQPIPMLDAALITPIQILMVQAIASSYGYRLDRKSVLEIFGVFGASIVTQNLVIAGAKLIPIAGWLVSISVAYALTYAIGKAADVYFASGRCAPPSELRSVFERTYQEKKREKQKGADPSLKDRLAQLTRAFEAGILTEEEFAKKKEELLRDF